MIRSLVALATLAGSGAGSAEAARRLANSTQLANSTAFTVGEALLRRSQFTPASGVLFVRVPKTGSSTTRQVVRRLCGRYNCSQIEDHPEEARLRSSLASVYCCCNVDLDLKTIATLRFSPTIESMARRLPS